MDTIKVPFIITCQVTGIPKVYTSKTFVQRKLANYDNDMDKMRNRYVCKDARRVIRETVGDAPAITADHIAIAIKTLGGTTDANAVYAKIQAGELDLKKVVKRTPKVPGVKKAKAPKAAKKSAKKSKNHKKARKSNPAIPVVPAETIQPVEALAPDETITS